MSNHGIIQWQTKVVNGILRSTARRVRGGAPSRLEQLISGTLAAWLKSHPCIAARTLGANHTFYMCVPGDLTSISSCLDFLKCLDDYFEISDDGDPLMKSLLCIFHDPIASKHDFFDRFWQFIQLSHDIDSLTHAWDSSVSSDPKDKNFELSFRGRAVFPTTFHPAHDRPARRFSYPGWAHNQSAQFALLREQGEFESWQRKIRKADSTLDPSQDPNPLLADSGEASAAAQLGQLEASHYPFLARCKSDREQVIANLMVRALAEKADDVVEYIEAHQ